MLSYKIIQSTDSLAPLVVLVHGRSGTFDVMQTFRSAVPATANIVSIQAPLPDPEGGFRWWEFGSSLEFSERSHSGARDAATLFENWLEIFLKENNLQPRTIVAIGFSQGAALLSFIIQDKPKLLSAVALLAGFVVKIKDSGSLIENSRARVLMLHGSQDQIVPLEIAEEGKKFLEEKGFKVEFTLDQVSHKIGINGMKALKAFILENTA